METKEVIYKYIFPLIGLSLIVLLGVLAYVLIQDNIDKDNSNSNTTSTNSQSDAENSTEDNNSNEVTETFTREFVISQGSSTNCYTLIDNDVYLIPQSFINIHEGGAAEIVKACGIDASEIFSEQHAGSAEAKAQLAEFKVGAVQNKTYTLSNITVGNTRENCLMAIDSKAYLISEEYIDSQHPAGAQGIISNCGKDATTVFGNIHEGSGWAASDLARYYIGDIVNGEFD